MLNRMGLRDLGINDSYRTGSQNLVRDFYRPCLGAAVRYDRAVGYFTSTSLAAAADGLRPFLERSDSRMRLIASPALTDEDVEAIESGYDLREVVRNAIDREIARDVPDAVSQRLQLLTWLIAHDRLELKLAIVRNQQRIGIYHEKLGVFSDGDDTVVFVGSANESASGLLANFESVEVFRSWLNGESERVRRRVSDFEALWSDQTPGLSVLEFSDASQQKLLSRYEPSMEAGDEFVETEGAIGSDGFRSPSTLELRRYQKDAIRAWWEADGIGIWEMATGTGKTITALAAMAALWNASREDQSLLVVVTVPYQHLADQWAIEARKFGASPILAYEGQAKWSGQLDAALAATAGGRPRLTLVIAVNATFCSTAFQERLRLVPGALALVSDEVHTTGATRMRQVLPASAQFRLGLSATPERHLDTEGTEAVRSYFGDSVYQLGLKRAIELGALVPYRYFPIIIELTEDELDEYVELTKKIANALGRNTDVDPDDAPSGVDLLLFKRARLIGSASNKIQALRDAISPYRRETHTLVYCADRTGDSPQLNQVLALLGSELGIHVNTFTAEEDRETRKMLLDRFTDGELQALAAIRCLDEGVDVPATQRAFILASSQNPRQFIQRRGRVLRQSPGKTSADIYDFLVSPPDLSDDPAVFELERKLVGRELLRALELCDAATNSAEALTQLRPLRDRYDLLSLAPGVEPFQDGDGEDQG
jgi:DNA phosphorothioation system restriction enzyme